MERLGATGKRHRLLDWLRKGGPAGCSVHGGWKILLVEAWVTRSMQTQLSSQGGGKRSCPSSSCLLHSGAVLPAAPVSFGAQVGPAGAEY